MKKIILLFAAFIMANISFSQDAESYFKTGQQLKDKEDYKGAIDAYTKAVELDPKHINALLQRAFCNNAQGNYDACVADYTAILANRPDHKFSHLSRGTAYYKLKKYKEALADFNRVIELDPENQEAYNNRGKVKKETGDFDGACKDWNKSKKLGNDEAKIIIKNNKCK